MKKNEKYTGTPKDQLTPDKISYAALCRENTGRAICDSGDAYGRGYEKEPVIRLPRDGVLDWNVGDEATLCVASYLTSVFPIDRKLQQEWAIFDSKNELNWFESAEEFLETRGYVLLARDNVYNQPNSLSQVFIYAVWAKPNPDDSGWRSSYDKGWSYDREWWYLDNLVTVIHIHTGCDVRSGYSRPVFSTGAEWEDVLGDGFVAGYRAESGKDVDGADLSSDALQAIDERWQLGYSSEPMCQLNKDTAEWVDEPNRDERGFYLATVKLHTGERIVIRPEVPQKH